RPHGRTTFCGGLIIDAAPRRVLNREVAPTQSGSRADMDPPRRRVMAELKRAARQGQCPSWSRPPAPAAPLSTKAGRNRRLGDVRVLGFLASESTTRICGLPGPNCDLIEVCLQRLSGTLLFSKIATGDTISSTHLVDGVDHSSSS